MANVKQISVLIKMGARGMAAGTHGDAYLGIGCKEFYLTEFKDEDFQPGLAQTIVLSGLAHTNLLGEEINTGMSPDDIDSCSPYQIVTENLLKCPLYIRLEPGSRYDYWDLDEIRVTVNPGSEQIVFSALGEQSYLWSGDRGPKVLYLGESITH